MFRLNRPVLLGLSVAACLLSQGSAPPIDNDQVRVVNALDQPHSKGSLHQHLQNRVMVYMAAGEQEIISQDGKKTLLKFKTGDVKWSPASGMHTSEIHSNNPVPIVEIEVKKPGDKSKTPAVALDPLKLSPNVYSLEFENDQVRVLRVKYAPHQAVPQHEHVLNRVVVYLTGQHSKMSLADGTVQETQHKAGEVSTGGPGKHAEQNLLDTPLETIMVELKN